MRLLWGFRAGWVAGGISAVVGMSVAALAAAWDAERAKPPSGLAGDAEAYLRYVHPTVEGPYPDGVNLRVPAELGDRKTAAIGLVDVTQKPIGADPTGNRDATKALQDAINFARDHQMVCFFPPGTYRISETLTCAQQLYRRSNGRVLGAHLWPCVLMGSRAGKDRPRILLAPRSAGFGDPREPKHVVRFWARGYLNATTAGRVSDGLAPDQEQPNISMNQMFVNLDIVVGEGNPGAVALRHQAAEGSAIEDCTIDVTHGLIGIQGGIGSGGGSANVTVIGGRIGLDFTGYLSGTQPTPTITGFTLIGQTEAAIRSTSRQTLVAPGLKIVATKCAGPLIVASGLKYASPANGQLSLVDAEIVFGPPALGQGDRVVVSTDRNLYLNNVYVRGATKVAVTPEGTTLLPGNGRGWLRVVEFARGQTSGRFRTGGVDLEYRYPVYVDGSRRDGPLANVDSGPTPPADLQSRHLWSRDFPHAQSLGAVNVKSAPYRAAGDGVADDTAALQRAIDEHEIVFLPKGYYRLTRTLQLRPQSKLVGVGQHLSVLVAKGDGEFADPAHPSPLIRTANDAHAGTVLAFCGLFAANDLPGVQALDWRCGGRSVFRAVEICEQPIDGFVLKKRSQRKPIVPRQSPLVLVTGHGGGNWYNFRGESAWNHGPGYRHLLIEKTAGPLNFYQCSPQHVVSDCAVELRHAEHVSFFGTKYEGNAPMLKAVDCDHLRSFGHGGNGKPLEGSALFLVARTPNFLLANVLEGPTRIVPGPHRLGQGDSTDPRAWSIIIERPDSDRIIKTLPMERPVVYRRGSPEGLP